jgi:uncharacterized damage-inducible protein DinB
MPMIDALLQELDQEAMATRRALERVPADRMTWRPHAKSRTLGELAVHIATVPGNIAEMAARDTFDVSAFPPPPSIEAGELPGALDRSVAAARAALTGVGDERLGETWQMIAGGQTIMAMPRLAVLRTIMLNHWYHHRGQLTVYLRELDIPVPSIYGPSADENPFARPGAAG